MPTTTINARDITGLRIVCRACNAQMVVPVASGGNPPNNCFSCNARMPGHNLRNLLVELDSIRRLAADVSVGFDTAIEGQAPTL